MKKSHKKIAGFLSIFGLAFLVGCSDAPVEAPKAVTPPAEEKMMKEDEAMKKEEVMEDKDGAMEQEDETVSGDGATGEFSADGTYTAPPGEEAIGVAIALAEGVITAVEITPTATNEVSAKWQGAFAESIGAEVIGKSIEDAQVDIVGGSSLTGEGFNAALETIKGQI